MGEEHSQIYCKVAGTAYFHMGKKNLAIRGLKEVRKCALNREWRSSDVFSRGDRFCEVDTLEGGNRGAGNSRNLVH